MPTVKLTSNTLQASFNLKGAELCSVKNKQGLEYIWQADAAIWPRHAPILFPIVGKLLNNAYTFLGNKYEMGQHGFARDFDFTIINQSETSCVFELRSNSETKKNYPFDFILQVKYLLSKNIIRTEYRITNPSKSQLLYSIGAHPGFNCPLLPNEKMEDYYLEFEKDSFKIRQLDEGLRNVSSKTLKLENNKLVLSPELFKNDALVFENSQIKTLKLASSKSTHSITLQCKSWPYFGIWTKKECNRFICLEPWQGIADSSASSDAFETKEGILLLNAKEEHLHSFSLTFS